MAKFSLYQSGIHYADLIFGPLGVRHKQLDVFKDEWEEEADLSEEENQSYIDRFMVSPLALQARLAELEKAFNKGAEEVITSWGALYCRDEENEHLFVERKKKNPLDAVVVDGHIAAFIIPGRESVVVLAKEGYEDYTPLKIWRERSVSPAEFGVEKKGTFMIPMRDGVRLCADVWAPSGCEGSFPVILVRTPYGKAFYSHSHFKYVKRGYVVVIQDVRGREDSEGEWLPNAHEKEDGDDTINWLVKQPWCNGSVGMIGGSYGGFVQWAAAASGNPHLKALVSIVTAGGPFIDLPRKGGALMSGLLAWAFSVSEKRFKREYMIRDDWDEVMKMRPLASVPKRALGRNVRFWDAWMKHEKYDEFWAKTDWHKDKDLIDVPALVVSGWFDDNGMGTTEALDVIADYKPQDRKVILGPWLHNSNSTRDSHGGKFGNNALRYDLDYYYQAWFDFHLKGLKNGIDKEPRVEYYTTGDNRWRQGEKWLPDEVEYLPMYLTSGGAANSSRGDGELTFSQAAGESTDTYIYDPDNPAPYLIDVSENEVAVPGNYKEADLREDVLVYTSQPLQEDLTVVGDLYVEFYAASSAPDTDWVVKVSDVDEEGNSIKLADGILRAKFRNGFDRIDLLTPGKVEKYVIRTTKLGNTFKKGHRIRLTITSSADNLIFPNPNTGEELGFGEKSVKAEQKIFTGGPYPSRLKLPILREDK